MKVQVKVAVKVQIHFSHPEKLVPRPRELSRHATHLQAKRGDTPQTKFYIFSPNITIKAPWSEHLEQATKHSVFHFFSFFPVINSLREHPFFSTLVSSLFFGVREATTGNKSSVRRLVQFKRLRMYRKENADLCHENIIVMAFLIWIKTNSGCLRHSLSVTSRFKLRVPSSPSKKN